MIKFYKISNVCLVTAVFDFKTLFLKGLLRRLKMYMLSIKGVLVFKTAFF